MEELEKLRNKMMKKQDIIFLLCTLFTGLIMYLLFSNIGLPAPFAIGIFIFCLPSFILFSNIFIKKEKKEYSKKYKEIVVKQALDKTFKDVNVDFDFGFESSVLKELNMIKIGNRYRSNDFISGKYKNISFQMSDVLIQNITSTGKSTTIITFFEGQWFIFDFNKDFKTNIELCEKDFHYKKVSRSMKKIELEDISFNQHFSVYGENELDTFYILIPNMMEKITDLSKKVDGDLLLGFKSNKLYIGLNNGKDLFEPDIYSKMDIEKDMKKVEEEISIITDFVDILKLDNTLFKRNS